MHVPMLFGFSKTEKRPARCGAGRINVTGWQNGNATRLEGGVMIGSIPTPVSLWGGSLLSHPFFFYRINVNLVSTIGQPNSHFLSTPYEPTKVLI